MVAFKAAREREWAVFLFRAVSGVGALLYNGWAVVRTMESDSGNWYREVVQSD